MSTVYSAEHLHNGYSPATNNYTNGQDQPMDGRQPEYSQSGLSSPYQSYSGQHSEEPTVDHASAAHYSQTQDVKFNPGATPAPDYGLSTPTSRSGPFPDYMQQRAQYPDGSQRYHAQGAPGGSALNMVQPSSPSTPLDDGQSASHQDAQDVTSNTDVPLDPSIVGASPTYAQHHYSPYAQSHEMAHYQPAPPGMYGRAEYGAPYPGPHSHAMPSPYAHVPGGVPNAALMPAAQRPPGVSAIESNCELCLHTNSEKQGGHPMSTVYSFVPIPGTHQQKRPRRRFEEIERMYKCGWNGCEKAYGTLNHLNAHVTMQAHGHKRTPEGNSDSILGCTKLTRGVQSSKKFEKNGSCGKRKKIRRARQTTTECDNKPRRSLASLKGRRQAWRIFSNNPVGIHNPCANYHRLDTRRRVGRLHHSTHKQVTEWTGYRSTRVLR